jgi:DNA gyrase subunit A
MPDEPNVEETTAEDEGEAGVEGEEEGEEVLSSQRSYRTQHRGGKGLRDIKTSARNGPVIGCVRVDDDDELLMISARGKLQRIAASDVSIVGRNTQGVRIMSLDEDDTLVALKRLPREDDEEEETAPDEASDGNAR